MASENKTKPTDIPVDDFLAAVTPDVRRADALVIREMIERISGEPAVMWGPTMVGCGRYRYRYDSGREGDMFRIGFAPRKPSLVLYIDGRFPEFEDLYGRLGKVTRSVACIYVKRLSDVDMTVLQELMTRSIAAMRQLYPTDT